VRLLNRVVNQEFRAIGDRPPQGRAPDYAA
jgi:hypothetical protein